MAASVVGKREGIRAREVGRPRWSRAGSGPRRSSEPVIFWDGSRAAEIVRTIATKFASQVVVDLVRRACLAIVDYQVNIDIVLIVVAARA